MPYLICKVGYTERDIFFVYNGASVPWIISVHNFWVFTNISESRSPTSVYHISLEMSFYSTSAGVLCIKIHSKMVEQLQAKGRGFIFTGAPCIYIFSLSFFKYGFI